MFTWPHHFAFIYVYFASAFGGGNGGSVQYVFIKEGPIDVRLCYSLSLSAVLYKDWWLKISHYRSVTQRSALSLCLSISPKHAEKGLLEFYMKLFINEAIDKSLSHRQLMWSYKMKHHWNSPLHYFTYTQ